MANPQMRALARRIAAQEKAALGAKQPNLGFSTVEGGAVQVTDMDDALKAQVGLQFDGTHTVAMFNGPTPPTPTTPIVSAAPGGLKVRWNGFFTDAQAAPMDFSRVEVHVSLEDGFDALSATTLQASIETPRGAEVFVALPGFPDIPHYVVLATRNQSGKRGPNSAQASAAPGPPAHYHVDTKTATVAGDQTLTLTHEPMAGSEDVKWNGLGQPGQWIRLGKQLTVAEEHIQIGDVITVEYAYLARSSILPNPIVPVLRDSSPQQLNGWTTPDDAVVGDLLVAVAMMPSSESVTDLNGWTSVGVSEYVVHEAAGGGPRTYRLEIYSVIYDGSGDVPALSNTAPQDVVCGMVAFTSGSAVTAIFDTLDDGTGASAPAQDPTALRVWGTISNSLTITPSRGELIMTTNYVEIDIAMTIDPDPTPAPATSGGSAGWCLASLRVDE